MFHVGQKVKYIGPAIGPALVGNILIAQNVPVPDGEYTVRACGYLTEPSIRLVEIINAPRKWANGFYELWMEERFFRPIVDRKTDIGVLTALLNPANHKELEII